ncbi:PhzF family phenazine biosynthesis protein [Plantactinospora sp. KBS50]|uniref:PhzF family phenazine biosynthesis protein n=1 Tax=Plantactinospora sp. KBS50 TaxID=2024580 RepID=UPI000BAB1876|nr:PhzF family phenazine biosynthesis protein [Plantactinospora sp. KBS50]ASW57382.1 phenazine biosynthesis protein PhzF [Plantactinospora sp. KBS50]
MSSLSYEIVDVFTDRPFAGNPLAVVFGAEDLAASQLLDLTREFNLSETVFILPPTRAGATYRARIFTVDGELPFAGHPSVGAAVTGSRRGDFPAGDLVQECGAGLLPITVADGQATLSGGTPTLGPQLDPGPLLAVAGLADTDLAGPPPRTAGCGLEFPYLSVRPDAVARAAVDIAAARRYGVNQLMVLGWHPQQRTAYVRMFGVGLGVPEDPATGSAALGLGVWLVATGLLPGDGENAYTVRQGIEIHRPSTLECRVTAAGGAATAVTVTGHVVPVARGEIMVPPFVG